MEQNSKRCSNPRIQNREVREQLAEPGWLMARMLLDVMHLKDPSTSGHSVALGNTRAGLPTCLA
jgi:hypothetical protein